jgi:hypothetical protein
LSSNQRIDDGLQILRKLVEEILQGVGAFAAGVVVFQGTARVGWVSEALPIASGLSSSAIVTLTHKGPSKLLSNRRIDDGLQILRKLFEEIPQGVGAFEAGVVVFQGTEKMEMGAGAFPVEFPGAVFLASP